MNNEDCCGGSCGCGEECGCGHEEDACCQEDMSSSMGAKMLNIAQDAYMELLHEKMKQQMEKKVGKQLDAIASLTADMAIAYMQGKMDNEQKFEEFEEKLRKAMQG